MSRMRLGKLTVAAGMTVAALFAATPAVAMEAQNLRIASFGQKSSWYAYSVGLAEILREVLPQGSTIDTPPEGGGTKNPLLVATGKFDLAFGMAAISGWAKDGKVAYDQKFENLRALVGGFDQYYLGILVNEPGVTATLDEYVTKQNPDPKVILLGRGSAGGAGGSQMLAFAGASQEQVESRGGSWEHAGSFGVVLNQLAAGNADLWIHTITVGHPAMTEAALKGGASFVEPSEGVREKMAAEYGWQPAKLPKGAFEGQDRELTLPGTSTNLFVRSDMSDELAYTITKALCERTDKFKSYHKALKNFDCQAGVSEKITILPLHPGAVKYFKEKGWM